MVYIKLFNLYLIHSEDEVEAGSKGNKLPNKKCWIIGTLLSTSATYIFSNP
jgi:hypothetical protein